MEKLASLDDVLKLISLKKQSNPQEKVSLKALLKENGFEAKLEGLNFHVAGENGTVKQWRPEAKTKNGILTTKSSVPRRTTLLNDIDFTGIAVNRCQFDQCDLSGAVLPEAISDSSFQETCLDNATIHNSTFKQCDFTLTSFDYSDLSKVTFNECQMNRTGFNYLTQNKDVSFEIHAASQFVDINILGCKPGGISVKNTGTAEFEIQDLTSDQDLNFIKVKYNRVSDRPKIILPWNTVAPSIAASLTEKQLQRTDLIEPKSLNPIRINYTPSGIDLLSLDKEVTTLTGMAEKYMKQLETDLMKQSKLIAAKASEGLCPQYASMTAGEIFTELWREKKESHAMSIFYIMREENQRAIDAGKSLPFPMMDKMYHYALTAYNECDGIMIPGGSDIDPRFYGEKTGKTTHPLTTASGLPDLRRDVLEFSLIYIQQRSAEPKPLHAICRGSQLIAAAYGAKMHQELNDRERDAFYFEPMQFSRPSSPVSGLFPTGGTDSVSDTTTSAPKKDSASAPPIASVSLASLMKNESDEDVMNLIFFHHQGFSVVPSTHGLVAIAESTTKGGNVITVAAENLPQNIGIVQNHPEFAHGHGLGEMLSATVAKRFFQNIATMANAFANGERKGISDFRALLNKTGDITLVETKKPITKGELNALTSPGNSPAKTNDYDSIVIGLGPVGLTSAISAIERGEKIALVTDRALHGGLGVRQQVLGVDEVMDWVSQLVRPELLEFFITTNRMTRTMYQPPDGSKPYPYWTFSTGALEELLVAELEERIHDKLLIKLDKDGFFNKSGKDELLDEINLQLSEYKKAQEGVSEEKARRIIFTQYLKFLESEKQEDKLAKIAEARNQLGIDIIEVEKIPPNMTADIDLSKGLTYSAAHEDSLLRPSVVKQLDKQKSLRERIDISDANKTLSLGGIHKINDRPVKTHEKRQAFGFHDVVASNGAKQQAEKAMAGRVEGDDVHLTLPLYKSHVATIFSITGTTTFNFGKDPTAPKALESKLVSKMLDYCKKNKNARTPVPMSDLRKYGWEPHSRPHQQVYTTGGDNPTNDEDRDYLYIGCEYPEALKPERLKEFVNIMIASKAKPVSEEVAIAYSKIPPLILEKINAYKTPVDQLKERDYQVLSKSLARDWSRMLLKDALPEVVCVVSNITDPEYSPTERGKDILSTSQFDLGFFELGRSIYPLGSRESGRAFFISVGDGRMFPLYTTGTGAQTGLKLARLYDKAKRDYMGLMLGLGKEPKFQVLMSTTNANQLDPKKCESHQVIYNEYLDEVEKIVGKVYGEYHAASRQVIDEIREVQGKWIDTRNQRFQKAEQVFEILQDAIGLEKRVSGVLSTCQEITQMCSMGVTSRQPGSLHSNLSRALKGSTLSAKDQQTIIESVSVINQKMSQVKDSLKRAYTQYEENDVISYEELPQFAMKFDSTVDQYYEQLQQACLELHHLSELVGVMTETLNKTLPKISPESLKSSHGSISEIQSVLDKIQKAGKQVEELLECGLYKKHLAKLPTSLPPPSITPSVGGKF
jgi:gamma-glutamyl-gamma-aminobutyrate hydrolase PuuD/uncharacterized protein YjbI with pentapeptide repeats